MTDPRPALEQMAADLVAASEKHARNNNPQPERPEPRPWLVIHHVSAQEGR